MERLRITSLANIMDRYVEIQRSFTSSQKDMLDAFDKDVCKELGENKDVQRFFSGLADKARGKKQGESSSFLKQIHWKLDDFKDDRASELVGNEHLFFGSSLENIKVCSPLPHLCTNSARGPHRTAHPPNQTKRSAWLLRKSRL